MKELLTIGEFAKLRNVTTETLRHYDRVGLLKPIKIDEHNNRRYYSITQYEKLGTIKELRQLGISIEDIKKYFECRNIEKSYGILKKEYIDLSIHIEKLKKIEKSIAKKLKFIEEIKDNIELNIAEIKEINERKALISKTKIGSRLYEGYEMIKLENKISSISPILATDKMGVIANIEDMYDTNHQCNLFIILDDDTEIDRINEDDVLKLKEGSYVCINYSGDYKDRVIALDIAMDYIKSNNYSIDSYIIHIAKVDVSITDDEEEIIYEIQIPLK